MIAPDSASYPVLGAARAAGVDYALALAWVDSVGDPHVACDLVDSLSTFADPREVEQKIRDRHGHRAFAAFFDLIDDAWEARRVRVLRWSVDTNGWRP